jgi:hypothetical protein
MGQFHILFEIMLKYLSFVEYCEEDPLGYLMGAYDDEVMDNADQETVSFKSYSLKYITQPRSFVNDLENRGLNESTISSCFESSDEEIHEDMESNPDFENFRKFSETRKRKPREDKSETRQKLSKIIDLSQSRVRKLDLKKLSEISDIVMSVLENFPLVDPMDIVTNQSASLQWLIQVCAEIIQVSPESLRSELVKFQTIMFSIRDRRDFLMNIANKK